MCILDKILDLLKERNLSQKQLCLFLGLKQQAFTNWKNGNNDSYKKYLPQIAAYFDVSVDYLLGKEEKKAPDSENRGIEIPYDMAERMDLLMKDLEKEEALMFDGEPMDEETIELLKASLKNSYAIALAKKNTAKKYKGKKS